MSRTGRAQKYDDIDGRDSRDSGDSQIQVGEAKRSFQFQHVLRIDFTVNVFRRFSRAHFLSQLRIHDRLDVLKALPSTKNEVRQQLFHEGETEVR